MIHNTIEFTHPEALEEKLLIAVKIADNLELYFEDNNYEKRLKPWKKK